MTSESRKSPSESVATSPTSKASDNHLWEVQAILAERHSRFRSSGSCNEVLVVWKPEWIPIADVPSGPILSSFKAAPKVRFMSSVGKLILPVEPDTPLAYDVAAADAEMEQQLAAARRDHHAAHREHRTPRKSLGGVAKRAAAPRHD
jgi:hypothetical protein